MSYQSFISQALQSMYKKKQQQGYGQPNQGYSGYAGQGYGGYGGLSQRPAETFGGEQPLYNQIPEDWTKKPSTMYPGSFEHWNPSGTIGFMPRETPQQSPIPEALMTEFPQGNFGKPAIRTWGWGVNYYTDEAGNKINNNPEIDYYYDNQGHMQYFDKPQIDWGQIEFGQDPFNTPSALLGDETILNRMKEVK